MTDRYEPELGQMVFGQPYKEFAVSNIVEAALVFIQERLDVIKWNIEQKEFDSPFGNTGNGFKNDTFEAYAYSWSDEEQPFNFKWEDIEISWYKYLGRGMSANKEISADRASEMLVSCIKSLDQMDDDNFNELDRR